MKTLKEIREMEITNVIDDIVRISNATPIEYRAGVKRACDVIEWHDNYIYWGIAKKVNPTSEEGLKIDYACMLFELDELE